MEKPSNLETIPTELEILLRSIRFFLGTSDSSCLEGLLHKQKDWSRLLNLSKKHGLMPLLYWSIIACDSQVVPENVLTHLRNEFRLNSEHNLLLMNRLMGIMEVLNENGIQVTSLRGPTLALQAYGDISLRQFMDLDILVGAQDVEVALFVLREHGYESERFTKKELATLIRYGYDIALYNKKLKLMVELHWRISERIICQGPDSNSIIERSGQISVLDRTVLSPSPEDMLLLLCQHGTKHAWDKLSLACDIACLLKSKGINFQRTFELAQGMIDRRSLVLGLLLVSELFKFPIPQYIQEEASCNKNISKLTDKTIQRILSVEKSNDYQNSQDIRRHIFFVDMLDQPHEKLLYISRLVVCPSEADFKVIILPAILYPLYFFIRPLRLFNIVRKAVSEYSTQKKK